VGKFCKRMVEHIAYKAVGLLVIVTCAVNVGAATEDRWVVDGTLSNAIIDGIDQFILYYFTVEIVIVTTTYENRPGHFFSDGWNVFDFFVVFMCYMPFAGGSVAVLRLLRLLRVLKLLKRVKQLQAHTLACTHARALTCTHTHTHTHTQVIVNGLVMGLGEIAYLMLLMLLVFYFFAVIALLFLQQNDPQNFGDMWLCFVTLFRVATLDNWSTLLYIHMYGCDNYGYDDADCTNSINGNLGTPSPGAWTRGHGTPNAQPYFALVFFIVFGVIAALILLAMFIGIVTTSMFEATSKFEEEEKERKLLADKDAAAKRLAKLMEAEEMKNTIRAISGEKLSAEEMGLSKKHYRGPAKYFMWLSGHTWQLTSHRYFQNFITLIILMAAVLVGLSADGHDSEILDHLNDFVLYVFTAEAVLKIFAEGQRPWRYFYDLWNIFDFGVVVGCYIPGAPNSVLQLLRLLRVVKIIRKVPQLHVIVAGLIQGMGSITYVRLHWTP
jgi:voltage-gated sodium channel